ncbi:tryptophan halogenase [Cellvibrio zantedeschiae]|uniref:Tryptophan halogenase n=1 Tax=Cellvibrio zantedeschiae TaxID=1237077 RepID=A0ABQ3BCC6_9GAMM|nr:tryptophan halogenase family protein [Cellvibrio zantedeschiae]GGY83899.1 tryptophan halogenase [Cellvibrio zantedeschiae]
MEKRIKQIVIVGGGSAGWLTAGLLAAQHSTNTETGLQITLVESPDVNTIGVGEGTWPSMRKTLQTIGLSETEFIRECSAAFKQGSKFVGWKNGRSDDFYYHPFTLPNGYTQFNLVSAWQAGFANIPFADAMCEQSHVCEAGRAPKQFNTPEYAGVANYGYHLDAGKFGMMLQKHCTQKLGVKHVLDHVTHINSAEDGDIESIATKNSGDIAGDLFIDCSGLGCLLIGQHFQIPFVEKKQFSLNDSAIAIQAPYAEENSPIASPTIATAQDAGWIWDIGLSSRRGTGHVYSSAHISDEQAEKTLRAYIAKAIGEKKAEELGCRKLSIRAGHRQKFWHKNCVAVGMSAGFIEPLEASALALVELSVNIISSEMPATREVMHIVEKRFNEVFEYRWSRVIEFLKLHYVLTQRTDTDYWRDAASPASTPDGLKELLTLWRHRAPYYNDFIHNEEVFPSASYQYVLYGMGFETLAQPYPKMLENVDGGIKNINATLNKVSKYIAGLPSNRELLEHVIKNGMYRG